MLGSLRGVEWNFGLLDRRANWRKTNLCFFVSLGFTVFRRLVEIVVDDADIVHILVSAFIDGRHPEALVSPKNVLKTITKFYRTAIKLAKAPWDWSYLRKHLGYPREPLPSNGSASKWTSINVNERSYWLVCSVSFQWKEHLRYRLGTII